MRKNDILSGALLMLLSGSCFQACQQDDMEVFIPERESLIAEGRYITARSNDASELTSDTEEPRQFEVGTPYRLFAFSKPYEEADAENEENTVNHPRFNKVAWEGETPSGLRFFNIDSRPDKWFGFSAVDNETGGDDGLVSLDFYGFTYGIKADHTGDYITVNGWTDGTTKLSELKHNETVTDGKLSDLMRGMLLNQNIKTAGLSKAEDGTLSANAYTQSVMPFRHCFSKLRFYVSQQGNEEVKDEKGEPTPVFNNLYVDKIRITGTYASGDVYLQNGKIKLNGDTCSRNLQFLSGFSGHVKVKNTDAGSMIVFPSAADALTDKPDGYVVGVNITVRSTEKGDIENLLVNTGSVDKDGKAAIKTYTDDSGTTWHTGTIVKHEIIDYYVPNSTTTPLYFEQNTSYLLIVAFQKTGVRIITVIPQVEEWLPGEGDVNDPWQEQAMGAPQMFNNILWSDRNLGANHYDPSGDNYERAVGYFYQAGRNIPYYPFNPNADDGTIGPDGTPVLSMIDKQKLSGKDTSWGSSGSPYKFYPIVDKEILRMHPGNWTFNPPSTEAEYDTVRAQMFIPETKPTDKYYNFYNGIWNKDDMHWEDGPANQPVAGAWVVPSSKDFMSIFPTTPHAGNIAMKRGGNNTTPMVWGDGDEYEENGHDKTRQTESKTLRVTVPFYRPGSYAPSNKSQKYIDAWNILKNNNDPGTTHLDEYVQGRPDYYLNEEPDGDPEDGYASAYVISREDGHRYSLSGYVNDETKFSIKEWGTVYAIKNIYTPEAYRMRWRALIKKKNTRNPCIYIEVCRYRCQFTDSLTETNYDTYDWDHPAARLFFPICGLGDYTGQYINFGTECQYATSDSINTSGKTSALQIKITGNNGANSYIAIVKNVINRNFGMQIRPIGAGGK